MASSQMVRSLGFLSAIVLTMAASVALAQPNERALENVLAVQSRHSARLMEMEGVVGTGTGLASDGLPAVVVYTTGNGTGPIPRAFGEIPVVVEVTGRIYALNGKPSPPPTTVDPTARFDPVPIGVSTGNEFSAGVGTVGCRLYRMVPGGPTVYYALSNHHVFDPWDTSDFLDWSDPPDPWQPLPHRIVQPGRGDDPLDDLSGEATQENLLGELAASVPIDYSDGTNVVDATIAEVPIWVETDDDLWLTREVLTSTPADGYGSPKGGMTVANPLNMNVQKYGRTTRLTKGVVQAINVNIEVSYDMFGEIKTAHFTNQISISGGRITFVKPGDSGSLIVTDPGRVAVGLLFAGDLRGRTGFANPIDAVLSELGV